MTSPATTRADARRATLARAAAQRRDRTLRAATTAIEELDRARQPINFNIVAQRAGVSRAWLYRETEIRDLITRLRNGGGRTPTTPAAQRASAASLRQRLSAATDEISRLRQDNTALREQLARLLGQQRTRPARQPQ
jgi:small-conductance mechanosensitive channel